MAQTPLIQNEARPKNPTPLVEADVYTVTGEFVLTYALPRLSTGMIFPAWQESSFPPPPDEDFAVFDIHSVIQHGRPLESFSADDPDTDLPGSLLVQGLIEVLMQVDFYGNMDLARQRAQRLAIVANSSVGVEFFNDRGMSSLYAEEVKNTSEKIDGNQSLQRYSVILHLSCWSGERMEMDYFDTATMARIEDVDAHHPSNQE